jgi:hypothetical protein
MKRLRIETTLIGSIKPLVSGGEPLNKMQSALTSIIQSQGRTQCLPYSPNIALRMDSPASKSPSLEDNLALPEYAQNLLPDLELPTLVLISHGHAPPLKPAPQLRFDVRSLPNPPKRMRDAHNGTQSGCRSGCRPMQSFLLDEMRSRRKSKRR